MANLVSEIIRGGITGTDAEVAAAFAGNVPHYEDHDPYDWARLIERLIGLGAAQADAFTLDKTIAALPGGELFGRMLDTGTDLAKDTTRTLIRAMRVGQSAEVQALLDLVLDAGVKMGPYWQHLGLPKAPTEVDVASAKQEIQARFLAFQLTDSILHDQALQGKTAEQVLAAVSAQPIASFEDAMNAPAFVQPSRKPTPKIVDPNVATALAQALADAGLDLVQP
jgi:hypothetical protein